jgi:hypothetical protein
MLPKMTDEKGAVAPEQTAPSTDSPQGNDGGGEQVDDLEALLKEHEEGTIPTSAPEKEETDQVVLLAKKVEALERRDSDRDIQTGMTKTVTALKGEFETLDRLANYQVEGLLDAEARRDERIWKAFANRNSDPEGWNKIVSAVGQRMADSLMAQPDAQRAADQEAARASVRGTSTESPKGEPLDTKKIAAMSDAEFDRTAKAMHGG